MNDEKNVLKEHNKRNTRVTNALPDFVYPSLGIEGSVEPLIISLF